MTKETEPSLEVDVTQHELVEEQMYLYMGKTMNLHNLIEAIGMADEPEEQISRKVNELITAGAVLIIEDHAHYVMTREQMDMMDDPDEVIHEEVQFDMDIPNRVDKIIERIEELGIQYEALRESETETTRFTLFHVKEGELKKIERSMKGIHFTHKATEMTNATVKHTSTAVKVVAKGIVEVANVAVRSTASVLAQTGSAVVNSAIEETEKFKKNMKEDEDVAKAKKNFRSWKEAAKQKIFGKGSSSDIFKKKK